MRIYPMQRTVAFAVVLRFVALTLLFAALRPAAAQVNVTTYHNDNTRAGQNLQETILAPANVNADNFGKLFSMPVDGQVCAQPLYLSGLNIPGKGVRNVVFIATQHDSVYAFDADDANQTAPLWKASLIPPGGSTVAWYLTYTGDIQPEIGITGTPVIDPALGTLYVVAKTQEGTQFAQRLHALDVRTGAERPNSPVTIFGSVAGIGVGNDGAGNVPFNPLIQNQRPALLLSNGVVYIAWAAHGDIGPYHGWIMGYDAATLQQTAIFNTSPNALTDPNRFLGIDAGCGIWQSGCGPAADADGNLYAVTGNGAFDAFLGGNSYGDSLLKLTPNGAAINVADYFTPYNQGYLDSVDADLGSGGLILLPDQNSVTPHLLVHAGKKRRSVSRQSRRGKNGAVQYGDGQRRRLKRP